MPTLGNLAVLLNFMRTSYVSFQASKNNLRNKIYYQSSDLSGKGYIRPDYMIDVIFTFFPSFSPMFI